MALKRGDMGLTAIPYPIPSPYDEFHPTWIGWIQSIDSKIIKIDDTWVMGIANGQDANGYLIINPQEIPKPDSNVSLWIPEIWVYDPWDQGIEQDPNQEKTLCDCNWLDVYKNGCKRHK